MAENPARKKAIDFLLVLNAAITNMRLYPPTSAIIQNSVERMFKVMTETLAKVGNLEYAESEKNLLLDGDSLPEKEQQRPQIKAFRTLMLDMGIRSLTFKKGITEKEITGFIQVLSKSAEEINDAGGFQSLLKQFEVFNILISEKIYVRVDPDHRIMSGLGIGDEEFARILTGQKELTADTIEKFRKMAANPEGFSRIFENGVRQVIKGTPRNTGIDLSETFAGMIDTLNGMTDYDNKEITGHIINSMSEMDAEVLATVLTQNLDAVFGEDFFARFVDELEPGRFRKLYSRIREMAEDQTPNRFDGAQSEAIQRVYGLMRQTSQGQAFSEGHRENKEAQKPGEMTPVEQKFAELKNALNRISKGEAEAFTEAVVAEALPETFIQLVAGGKDETAARLMERMGDALLVEDPDVRRAVAGIMAGIDEKLETAENLDQRIEIAKKLADWVKFETSVTREFETVSARLQDLAEILIRNGRAGDADPIIEAYHRISTGNLKKSETISALARNMLQNLATEDILDLLLKEPKKNGHKKGKDDINALTILGTTTMERLLDMLRDSHNMSERNRIVQAVSHIGEPALAPITERLKQDGPWYYIRNLVLLLGRLGGEKQLPTFGELMGHPDYRVQREVIKSIQSIGGNTAGRMLYEHIDTVNEQLIGYLISVIGALPYPEAAPRLIEMLSSRTVGKTKAERDEIMEKICEALGRMRSKEAIPALDRIARSTGFFGRKSPEVRSAAARALANIQRENAQS